MNYISIEMGIFVNIFSLLFFADPENTREMRTESVRGKLLKSEKENCEKNEMLTPEIFL